MLPCSGLAHLTILQRHRFCAIMRQIQAQLTLQNSLRPAPCWLLTS